jgi:glycosyltransferase involved in cell wall biosynthesis
MWNGQTVSVVFPVYNEEEGLLGALHDFFGVGWVDEVVVVDNNSSDRSAEIAQSTQARVVREPRQGYGFALRRGMREAQGDLIVLAEPDGTFLAKDVLKLLAYADDFDVVLGTRTTPELIGSEANMGIFLRLGNTAVAKLTELLFNGPSLSDSGCTLRLIRAQSARCLEGHFTVGGSHFLPEMVVLALLAKLRIVEVPINYRGRLGPSKITGNLKTAWRVGWRMIQLVLAYRLRAWLGRGPRFPRQAAYGDGPGAVPQPRPSASVGDHVAEATDEPVGVERGR